MIKIKEVITKENIIEWSKPHHLNGGKITRIYNDEIEASIVGGVSGLYGDFKNDFEIAIFDRKNDEFITKFFYPYNNDDVVGYIKGEELVEGLNKMFGKGFQVR
jgi:hypothetical protein